MHSRYAIPAYKYKWYRRWESNPQSLRNTDLNRARLPIPPRRRQSTCVNRIPVCAFNNIAQLFHFASAFTPFFISFRQTHLKSNKKMARETGLEPATSTVTGWHSNQLSYSPAFISGVDAWKTPCCCQQLHNITQFAVLSNDFFKKSELLPAKNSILIEKSVFRRDFGHLIEFNCDERFAVFAEI